MSIYFDQILEDYLPVVLEAAEEHAKHLNLLAAHSERGGWTDRAAKLRATASAIENAVYQLSPEEPDDHDRARDIAYEDARERWAAL